ncbi:hypothetical protein L7F22_031773 [Adiantum nelumboides]|nr:hypothetical protein [Adiantum nelumboides]
MMRFIMHQSRRLFFGGIPCLIRNDAVCEDCVAKSLTQNLGGFFCFSLNDDMERSKPIYDALRKQPASSSCTRSVSLPCHGGHSSKMGCHFYPDRYVHAMCLRQCRDLSRVTSQETGDLKHEVGSADVREAAWNALTLQMKELKDGMATGNALKALKGLVDQLEPSAKPTDLRLGLASLRLAQSFLAAGEEPSMYLIYAQRALKCLETLEGSWEHALCHYVLASIYLETEKYDRAVPHLEQCALVLQQMKGRCDDRYNNLVLNVHYILGQVERIRGKFHESLVHLENAIRIGKKSLKAGSPRLPTMYYQAALVCRTGSDPKLSMSFAQKALEGFMAGYGPSSLQVAKVKALMSGIHCDLQSYEDALSDYNEAKPIFEYLKETEEMAGMNLDIAKLLLSQNKSGPALPFLKEVINSTELTSEFHVAALVSAAKASSKFNLEATAEYFKLAVDAVNHQGASRFTVHNLVQLGLVAEKMKEFEHAAVLLQKASNMLDECLVCSPQLVLFEDEAGQLQLRNIIGVLFLRAGKVKKAIPYLQSSLKDAESGNGVQLFTVHFQLGAGYTLLNKKLEASKHLKACKDILSEWLYLHLIYAYYNLAVNNRSIEHMGALENLGISLLWFSV